MPMKRYSVIFDGEVSSENNVETVKKNLASFFKGDEKKIEGLFSGQPILIKKDTDFQTACKYMKVFRKAGAICKLVEIEIPAGAKPRDVTFDNVSSSIEMKEIMTCPKCGYRQKKSSECMRCGIVIKKMQVKTNKKFTVYHEPDDSDLLGGQGITTRQKEAKTRSSRKEFFFSRILPLIFVVVGTIFVLSNIRDIYRAKGSVNWPAAHGEILSSSVKTHHFKSSSSRHITFLAQVLYEFTLDGKYFTGKWVSYGGDSSRHPSEVYRIVNRYPKGKEVTVYYMPDNPKVCVLEPGVETKAYIFPGFGLFFIVLGIVAYWVSK